MRYRADREKCVIPRQALAVDAHVDLLVVERHEADDRLQVPGGEVVGPRQVGMHRVADPGQ